MELYLCLADQQTGPYTEAEARALVANGEITRACLAWKEGMAEWLPLEEVIAFPTRPSPPPVPKGLPPLPALAGVKPAAEATVVAPARPTSAIRTVSGVIALIIGLLAIFNIGGCVNARSKLTRFQSGDNAMDGVEMLVDTARGVNEGDPLRGVSGLVGKARSLQEDYESFQVGAWLCVVGTVAAGAVYRFTSPAKAA